MPQPGRTALQIQSSNGALVFRVDDDGPTRQLTAFAFSGPPKRNSRVRRSELLRRPSRQRLDHIRADVPNLFRGERSSERRHVAPARGHCLDDGSEIFDADERRAAAMPALAVRPVAGYARLPARLLAGGG